MDEREKRLWKLAAVWRESAADALARHQKLLAETKEQMPWKSVWWSPMLAVSQQYDESADQLERVLKGEQ